MNLAACDGLEVLLHQRRSQEEGRDKRDGLTELLVEHQLVEVVEVLAFDASRKRKPVEVISRSELHCRDVESTGKS